MVTPFEATADVAVRDGLTCITITAPGAPETVLRLPKHLAREMARRILSAADKAPESWPSTEKEGE